MLWSCKYCEFSCDKRGYLLMKRWPALFTNEQICLEFKRILGKDLQQEFYSALDDHTTRLMEIFKAKRGNVGEHLAQLLQQMQSLDPTEKRTVTLRGLPHLLGDNPTEFFKSSFDGDESFGQMDIGILLVNPESVSPPASDLHPASLKIVIEGEVVVEKLSTLPEAVCLLFGLTYGLHLNYPQKIRNTFQFIQQCSLEASLVQPSRAGKNAGATTFRRIAPKVPPGSEAGTDPSSGSVGDAANQTPLTRASEDVLSKCKKAAAQDHVLLVEGEKKYACKICCKTFMNLTDCKKHIRVHTGEKPYPCPKCGKRFSQSSHLYKHSKNTCLNWKDDQSFTDTLL